MNPEGKDGQHARRMRGFRLHLAGYVIIALCLALVNYLAMPGAWWFVLFVVGWGAPLAIHAAYAMGLFDGWRL
ncbi:MAG: 2TM domain-containing protein [Alphaproteobacteria bacterium]|nr:2TM domain-containing protein [Alphaproteobacteria bacterium]